VGSAEMWNLRMRSSES